MDTLYFRGEAPYVGRMVMYGTAFSLGLNFVGASMPNSKKAGLGAARAGVLARPPWVATALIVEFPVREKGGQGLAAARAMLLQQDAYVRPSEVFAVVKRDVSVPAPDAGEAYSAFALTIAPSTRDPLADHRSPRAAAKSGAFDDTVIIGDAASGAAGRDYIANLAAALYDNALYRNSRLFLGLSLSVYERLFNEAAVPVGLEELHLTPQALRHGGPSKTPMATSGASPPSRPEDDGWQSTASVDIKSTRACSASSTS